MMTVTRSNNQCGLLVTVKIFEIVAFENNFIDLQILDPFSGNKNKANLNDHTSAFCLNI